MRLLASHKSRGFTVGPAHFLRHGGPKMRIFASRKPRGFTADPTCILSWMAENETSRKS